MPIMLIEPLTFCASVSDSKWKKSHSHLKNSYHTCKDVMTYLKKYKL